MAIRGGPAKTPIAKAKQGSMAVGAPGCKDRETKR